MWRDEDELMEQLALLSACQATASTSARRVPAHTPQEVEEQEAGSRWDWPAEARAVWDPSVVEHLGLLWVSCLMCISHWVSLAGRRSYYPPAYRREN